MLADVPTESAAVRVPTAAGENVKPSVQLCPADSVAFTAQVPLRVKSPGFAPPSESDEIVSGAPPAFVNVTDFVPLDLPRVTLPNAIDVALIDATAGGGATAAAACVTTNVWPPIVRFADRAPPAFAAAR